MTCTTHSPLRPSPTRTTCAAQTVLEKWIASMIPGQSPAVSRLRADVLSFCINPMVRTALLRGPVGSGKSTIARIMACGRRIAPLDEAKARAFIQDIRRDPMGAISLRSMSWYVELAVTGLTDSLADGQLFGIAPGAATGVNARLGVFEQAAHGRSGRGDVGSELTGGVVFLDEIADIPFGLQAKLLPILSGGHTYRVGGEGNPDHEVCFDGVVIAATWHDLRPDQFRQDLLSRLSSTTICTPGLTERRDDLPEIITTLESVLIEQQQSRFEKLARSTDADRAFWRQAARDIRPLSSRHRSKLTAVDWSEHGNLRGLVQVMKQVLFERTDIDYLLSARIPIQSTASRVDSTTTDVDSVTDELLRQPDVRGGLANLVKSVERHRRTALRRALTASPEAQEKLARHLGVNQTTLKRQIQQLDRKRTRGDR